MILYFRTVVSGILCILEKHQKLYSCQKYVLWRKFWAIAKIQFTLITLPKQNRWLSGAPEVEPRGLFEVRKLRPWLLEDFWPLFQGNFVFVGVCCSLHQVEPWQGGKVQISFWLKGCETSCLKFRNIYIMILLWQFSRKSQTSQTSASSSSRRTCPPWKPQVPITSKKHRPLTGKMATPSRFMRSGAVLLSEVSKGTTRKNPQYLLPAFRNQRSYSKLSKSINTLKILWNCQSSTKPDRGASESDISIFVNYGILCTYITKQLMPESQSSCATYYN